MTHKEVKKRLIDLEITFEEFAKHLGVSRIAVYRALHGDQWLKKLRQRIADELIRLESQAA